MKSLIEMIFEEQEASKNLNKPRTWRIDLGVKEIVPETSRPSKYDVHVIEYSAYQQLEERCKELERKLEIVKDNLVFYKGNTTRWVLSVMEQIK